MLNLPRLGRLAESGDFERLLEEVFRNGKPLPLPIRLRLLEAEGVRFAALGLALQRVTQLTYRPMPVALTLVRALLEGGCADGALGTLASTAAALAGLLAFRDQCALLPRGVVDEGLAAEVDRAIARALHRLHRAQEESPCGCLGETPALIGDGLDSAIALWQLGLDPRFTGAVRYEDLLVAVAERGLWHERATAPLLRTVASEPAAVRSAA